MLTDTHCHLDAFLGDPLGGVEGALDRARDAGVERFVTIGVGETPAAAARVAVALAERHPDVWATVGVHPHDAGALDEGALHELRELARRPRVVAVGEIGLDFHYDHAPRDVQRATFRRLIALARELQKPIVVHTREAPTETLAILEEEGARDVGGIVHCMSEDRGFAARVLDLDFDLSFSGLLTFRGAREVQEVAAWAPEDRILVETDSPYLSPVPLRGRRNEPAFVVHTAAFLAALRGVTPEAIARSTTANATRRLGIGPQANATP